MRTALASHKVVSLLKGLVDKAVIDFAQQRVTVPDLRVFWSTAVLCRGVVGNCETTVDAVRIGLGELRILGGVQAV